jgi:TRAP-type mannitol/chloroaromatic compound transport system, periplasmic component
MKRRAFLTTTAATAVSGLAVGTVSAPALAQGTPTVRWRMATSWPKSLDTIHGSAEAMCHRVAQLTEGKFEIRPFAGGEIVPAGQVLDAVQNNTVECGHTLASFYIGKNTAYGIDGGLPFGLNARQHASWLHYGGGMELLRDFYGRNGLVNFLVGNVGVQMGGWYRKEIKSVEDLNGLKFRVGGFGGLVMTKLGVVPQQIAASDIYTGLEKGTIDAAEWIGPYDDEKLGFAKVAKYYYTPGWWEGSAAITGLVNTTAWNNLPDPFKIAFETAANEQAMLMQAKYDAKNPEALRRLVGMGVQLRAFPRPVMEACYKASMEVLKENTEKNPDFAKIYESWKAFHDTSNSWFALAENQLDSFRYTAQRKA